jgi:IS5 family transposase
MKNDNRMNCNKLKGKLGDKINAVLSACGFNFRKLLRAIAIFFVLKMAVFILPPQYSSRKAVR